MRMHTFDCIMCVGVTMSEKSSAVIARSLSFYSMDDIPTSEIEQTIHWLSEVRNDCEYKIGRLRKIQENRERSRQWRVDLNNLAYEFCDPDALHLDHDTRAAIIKQRLGCDNARAHHLADIVMNWAKNKSRRQRNQIIRLQINAGMKPAEIAQKHGISRQQVYNILKNTARDDGLLG